ncbi:MAG: hypothetical protein RSE13_19605 [Planktothrix sp. GU0601_MAG3]|nr:MAG: hypothetical protein RSE13_19605 [Planktothrix sp. GU0601_MAG3]
MKKTIPLKPGDSVENQFIQTRELTYQVRQDTMQDLENIGEDIKHLSLVVQSVSAQLSGFVRPKSTIAKFITELR